MGGWVERSGSEVRTEVASTVAGLSHAGLEDRSASSAIPQPAGWGSFTPAYNTAAGASPAIPQPAGWGSFTPAYTCLAYFTQLSLLGVPGTVHRTPMGLPTPLLHLLS